MLTVRLIFAQIFSILGLSTYAAVLPQIQAVWQLSHAEAGFIASSLFIGYVLVVPFATSLTDRMDARQVYLGGAFLAALGLLGMALFAHDVWSASVCHALYGAGVSATYMPGLKILSDRLSGLHITRHISFYTASFGIGTAASYYFAGLLQHYGGWRLAFGVLALGPCLAAACIGLGTRALPHEPALRHLQFRLSDAFPLARWRIIWAQKAARGFMLGYCAHSIELFASRSWLVAFLSYCAQQQSPALPWPFSTTLIATWVNLAGVPASILGNEMAVKLGRTRWVMGVMLVSSACGLLFASAVHAHWGWLLGFAVLHSITIMADSATLTAGLVTSVAPDKKGSAMGLHSLIGFGGALLGPLLFGSVLDVAHASGSHAWLWAYSSIVASSVVFVLLAYRYRWSTA